MAEISKLFIGWFEQNLSITGVFLIDSLLFLILEFIAYKISYVIVGNNAASMGYNKKIMSASHWIIRVLILVVTSLFVCLIFWIVNGCID